MFATVHAGHMQCSIKIPNTPKARNLFHRLTKCRQITAFIPIWGTVKNMPTFSPELKSNQCHAQIMRK